MQANSALVGDVCDDLAISFGGREEREGIGNWKMISAIS